MTDLNKYIELKKAVGEWVAITNEKELLLTMTELTDGYMTTQDSDAYEQIVEKEANAKTKIIEVYASMSENLVLSECCKAEVSCERCGDFMGQDDYFVCTKCGDVCEIYEQMED